MNEVNSVVVGKIEAKKTEVPADRVAVKFSRSVSPTKGWSNGTPYDAEKHAGYIFVRTENGWFRTKERVADTVMVKTESGTKARPVFTPDATEVNVRLAGAISASIQEQGSIDPKSEIFDWTPCEDPDPMAFQL